MSYHLLVLLTFYGMGIEDVSQEMRRREGHLRHRREELARANKQ